MHRFDVEIEGKIPILVRAIEHSPVVHIPRAVEQNVHGADVLRHRVDGLGRAHVERPAIGVEAGKLRFVEIGRDDFGPFGGEKFRRFAADSRACRR
jgi:hypothetical protein